jgi:hypothetical protein
MRILAIALLLAGVAFAQLPDAPSPPVQTSAKCGPWKCWNAPSQSAANVLKSKTFLAAFGTDLALTTMNAEVIHAKEAHGQCSIVGQGPKLESRGALYRHSLPENAAIGFVSFGWLKLKGPKAALLGFLAYPIKVHIKSTLDWEQDCF